MAWERRGDESGFQKAFLMGGRRFLGTGRGGWRKRDAGRRGQAIWRFPKFAMSGVINVETRNGRYRLKNR